MHAVSGTHARQRGICNSWMASSGRAAGVATRVAGPAEVRPAATVAGMQPFLDSLKWDNNGLVVAIAQHVDTGEVLMQAFADREAVKETLQTGCVPAAAAGPRCVLPLCAGRPCCHC